MYYQMKSIKHKLNMNLQLDHGNSINIYDNYYGGDKC